MTKGVPLALTQNLNHNHVLHEKVLLVAVTMTETPRVSDEDRIEVAPISDEITRVELRFGFMEQPDVPEGLEFAVARGQITKCDLQRVTYYTGRETIIPRGRRPEVACFFIEILEPERLDGLIGEDVVPSVGLRAADGSRRCAVRRNSE